MCKLQEMAEVLIAFFKNDRGLRAIQSENEPIADGMQQGTITDVAGVATDVITIPVGGVSTLSGFAQFLDGQESTGRKYSYIEILIEDTSGSGRYSIESGIHPTAGGAGHKIPSGGTTITIPGVVNIRNFHMRPETGQVLNYTMQGFI